MFDKVVICGMGVMGGSLGHSLLRSDITGRVCALVRREETIPAILEKHLAHEATVDSADALEGADLIVLATPVEKIPEQMKQLFPHLQSSMIVTDVGSVKKNIVRECEKIIGKHASFVGSHPMTGTEKFGFENFKKDLYQNAPCILTPTKQTCAGALVKVREFWRALGCRIFLTTPEKHDENVAWLSHLPHVLSFALLDAVLNESRKTPDLFEMAGGSFRDMTRVAGSSPELWTDILLSNQGKILKAMDVFSEKLARFRGLLKTKDRQNLKKLLSETSKAQNEFSKKQIPR